MQGRKFSVFLVQPSSTPCSRATTAPVIGPAYWCRPTAQGLRLGAELRISRLWRVRVCVMSHGPGPLGFVASCTNKKKEIVTQYPILINRAPTLHRLSIQGFYPHLTLSKSLELHPL
ncbi:16483_t:CDS:2, partial [Acaulospora morrowiae]